MTNNVNLTFEFKNRFINELGSVVFRGDDVYELLYQGKGINIDVATSEDIALYNQIMDTYGLTAKRIEPYVGVSAAASKFHDERQREWNMPIGYLEIDLYSYFADMNLSDEENIRIAEELYYFEKYNCMDVLRFLIYLVDTMREHKIVWGVGRGSSVASYCLYLIGVHRVNSLKYGLELDEFFKEKDWSKISYFFNINSYYELIIYLKE